jgi:hypothetical protein
MGHVCEVPIDQRLVARIEGERRRAGRFDGLRQRKRRGGPLSIGVRAGPAAAPLAVAPASASPASTKIVVKRAANPVIPATECPKEPRTV